MKRFGTPWLVLMLLAMGVWAGAAFACDHDAKTSAVTAVKSDLSTAEMAKHCSAAAAAACKAKGAAAAAECPFHKGAAATTAAAECPFHKGAAATTAIASSGAKTSTSASGKACATTKANAAAAIAGSCSSHGTGASAEAACKDKKSSRTSSAMADDGCDGHVGTHMSARHAAMNCDDCNSWESCSEALRTAGAHIQVIKLKNGVAFLYTADSPSGANAVQAAMARRSERYTEITRAGGKAKLCNDCKSTRDAVARGNITREIVSIEGGSMAIMTSNNPTIVARFHKLVEHAKVEPASAVRVRS